MYSERQVRCKCNGQRSPPLYIAAAHRAQSSHRPCHCHILQPWALDSREAEGERQEQSDRSRWTWRRWRGRRWRWTTTAASEQVLAVDSVLAPSSILVFYPHTHHLIELCSLWFLVSAYSPITICLPSSTPYHYHHAFVVPVRRVLVLTRRRFLHA